jgi:glycine cleavage system transcriptional repressor
VAAVTGALLDHEANVEDSQMAILRGHFTMVLILAAPEEVDEQALRADLAAVGERIGLESIALGAVAELAGAEPERSHVISVYGIDHPGIVHGVSSALGAREITITDLRTQLVAGEGAEPLYAMMIEVAAPPALDTEALRELLTPIAGAQGVELSVRELEQDAL